jgi:hypothetical protein
MPDHQSRREPVEAECLGGTSAPIQSRSTARGRNEMPVKNIDNDGDADYVNGQGTDTNSTVRPEMSYSSSHDTGPRTRCTVGSRISSTKRAGCNPGDGIVN